MLHFSMPPLWRATDSRRGARNSPVNEHRGEFFCVIPDPTFDSLLYAFDHGVGPSLSALRGMTP